MNRTWMMAGLFVAGLWGVLPASAATVVIVSSASGVGAMSQADVDAVFLGKVLTLPDGQTAAPVDNQALKDGFYQAVSGKSAAQLKSYWTKLIFTGGGRPLPQVKGDAEVIAAVSSQPGAIGYVDSSAVTEAVKVVFSLP